MTPKFNIPVLSNPVPKSQTNRWHLLFMRTNNAQSLTWSLHFTSTRSGYTYCSCMDKTVSSCTCCLQMDEHQVRAHLSFLHAQAPLKVTPIVFTWTNTRSGHTALASWIFIKRVTPLCLAA